MSKRRLSLALFCCAMLTLVLSTTATAGTVTLTGEVWIDDPTGATDAILANIPTTTPDVTFDVTTATNIEFSSYFGLGSCGITCGNPSASYTVGSFLDNGEPAATDIVENTPGALSSTLDNTIFLIEGTIDITTGEVFAVGHDDGACIYINGTVIAGCAPGPTSYELTDYTYTGPTIDGALLQIVYGECCGAPAVLVTNIPTGGGTGLSPEPAGFVLFGSGLVAVIALARRRVKTS